MEEKEKKKTWFRSLLSDSQWDWDMSKVTGTVLCLIGIIGFFLRLENFQWVLGSGLSLLVTGKIREG